MRFLLLIALTSLCSFASGIGLQRFEGKRWLRRLVCGGNIVLNLGILCYFKYCNFFGENFSELLRLVGLQADWVTLDILLPVGISFYTFQALSYTIDVYRGRIAPTRDLVAFMAFISFFPQLVAGPIERATNLLPQFLAPRTFNRHQAVDGMRQILWGFFKKVVVADNCAMAVNEIFADYQTLDSFNLLCGALLFMFQIYGDFSGYSDIAIGTARLFGIRLMRNFHYPYFSRNIAEFWKRWHISLNTWFTDYLYIPLGGSRCSRSRALHNVFIIFLISGFWHGANWTFVTWGLYHALLFVPLMWFGRNRKYTTPVAAGRLLPSFVELAQMVCTAFLAMIGWIIFRAEHIDQAWTYIGRMFTDGHIGTPRFEEKTFLFILFLLIVEWLQREKEHGLQITSTGLLRYRTARWGIYYGILIAILLLTGRQEDFIYFQF